MEFCEPIATVVVILDNKHDGSSLVKTLKENTKHLAIHQPSALSSLDFSNTERPVLLISDQTHLAKEAADWAKEYNIDRLSFLFIGSQADERFLEIKHIKPYSLVAAAHLTDENMACIVQGLLYSTIADQNQLLNGAKQELEDMLNAVKNQLSVFLPQY